MGKGYLIDSNVIIGYLDNKIPHDDMQLLHSVIDEVPSISVITKIEILRFNTSADAYQTLTDFVKQSTIYDLNDLVVDSTIALCNAPD